MLEYIVFSAVDLNCFTYFCYHTMTNKNTVLKIIAKLTFFNVFASLLFSFLVCLTTVWVRPLCH